MTCKEGLMVNNQFLNTFSINLNAQLVNGMTLLIWQLIEENL